MIFEVFHDGRFLFLRILGFYYLYCMLDELRYAGELKTASPPHLLSDRGYFRVKGRRALN